MEKCFPAYRVKFPAVMWIFVQYERNATFHIISQQDEIEMFSR